MIDVEDILRSELEALVPPFPPADWADVLARTGSSPTERRRRPGKAVLAAVMLALVIAVVLATPLGAAIADGFGGFSAWISGSPGSPAPKPAQQAFARANARTWLGFPAGTDLRLLRRVTQPSTGRSVALYGFRSGETLCLRVVASGAGASGSTQSCAPLSVLRHAGAPVRVFLVDAGFGRGKARAWYGLDHVGAPAIQVSAGVVADDVRSVTLHDEHGAHVIPATSDAFVYVSWHPGIGQRVKKISARTAAGRVAVPFVSAPFESGPLQGPSGRKATGPAGVQLQLRGGSIGWLDRREPRGEPLSVLPARQRKFVSSRTLFGRVIAPDPSLHVRVAVTLQKGLGLHVPAPFATRALVVCASTVEAGSAGGGCSRPSELFQRSQLTLGISQTNGSDQFVLLSGLASDGVARVTAFLSDGSTQAIPLLDNAYVAEIALAEFPIRLVGYDRRGRIVANLLSPLETAGAAARARGRPRLLLRAVSPTGATAELYAGKSTTGADCMYVRHHEGPHSGGVLEGCATKPWEGPPARLSGGGPSGIWEGMVRAGVARLELRFSDGSSVTVTPTDGYVLYAVPRRELNEGLTVVALSRSGRRVGTQVLPPPPRQARR